MKKLVLIVFVLLFLLSSCRNGELMQRNEMCFNISCASTKAISSAFETGDAISLYAVEWEGGIQYPLQIGGNFLNNERLAFDGITWSSTHTLFWGEHPCDFYALYPFQNSVTSIEKFPFTLSADQNGGGYETSDLLYASVERVAVNDPVVLKFRHLMSKLVVVLEKGESFEGEIPNDIVASVYNTTISCTVDLAMGSVAKDVFGSKSTLTMKKISNNRFESIIIPQNISKFMPMIELSMGGISYMLDYSLSFRPGYVHTITITLNTSPDQEQIEISIDPSSGNWN